MSFLNKKSDDKPDKKLEKKDIAIIILSVLSLILLIIIVCFSKQRDRQIAEYLQENKDFTTDDVLVSNSHTLETYIVISEVSPEKWVELYNSGTEPLDISGVEIYLGDKKIAAISDDTSLKKDQYYAVDVNSNPCALDHNVLSLKNKDGKVIKSILVPKTPTEKSYGCVMDENNTWGYLSSTKGKANSDKDVEYAKYNGISFSTPGGFYNGSFLLTLSCDEGEKIYYTTDGTTPTKDSAEYSGPIKIANQSGSKYKYAALAMEYKASEGYFPESVDAGLVVRAIAVDAKGNVTKEATQSYYVGLKQDSDYTDIPVLSICTDPENLFDYENGIYVSGRTGEDALIQELGDKYGNYYNKWKKPAIIEYFEPSKDKTFEINSDISIIIDDVTFTKQKNIRISMDKQESSIYEESSAIDHITDSGEIVLVQGGVDNDLKIRSYLLSNLADGLSIATYNYSPCSLFIDGEYWGLYFFKPDYDIKYIQNRYNLGDQEIIIRDWKGYNSDFAFLVNYVRNTDLSVEANYDEVKTMMDVENYAEFICYNMYVGNYPFAPKDSAAWKTASSDGTGYADGRWRFMCESLQNTLGIDQYHTASIDSFIQMGMQRDVFLQSLLMNDEFCNLLVSKMNTLSSTSFSEEKWTVALDNAVSLIKKPAIASKNRFFSKETEASYNNSLEYVTDFLSTRKDYILQYTKEIAEKGGDVAAALELERINEEKEKAKNMNNAETDEENLTDEEVFDAETETGGENLQQSETGEDVGVEVNG